MLPGIATASTSLLGGLPPQRGLPLCVQALLLGVTLVLLGFVGEAPPKALPQESETPGCGVALMRGGLGVAEAHSAPPHMQSARSSSDSAGEAPTKGSSGCPCVWESKVA